MRCFPGIRVVAKLWIFGLVVLFALVSAVTDLSAQTLQSISVSPSSATLPVGGLQQQFMATGTYSDGSKVDLTASATWGTTAGNVAKVNGGLATSAKTAGTATISATFNGVSGSASLTVTLSPK